MSKPEHDYEVQVGDKILLPDDTVVMVYRHFHKDGKRVSFRFMPVEPDDPVGDLAWEKSPAGRACLNECAAEFATEMVGGINHE